LPDVFVNSSDHSNEATRGAFFGNNLNAAVSADHGSMLLIQTQTTLLVFRTMTGEAIFLKNRLNIGSEINASAGRDW
jgi:hypothetical protein